MWYVSRLLLSVVLVLGGCKTEKLRERSNTSSEKPRVEELLIAGRVGAFWAENAVVSLYPIQAGTLDFDISETLTDASGEFNLTVPGRHSGNPMLIRVSIDRDSTRLRCSLPAGCNGVAVGALYSPEESFDMFLAIPELLSKAYYSVTPLSHIAFKMVEADISSLSDAELRAAIAQANSRVASRFGIFGELLVMPVADFVNDNAIHSASAELIKSSVLAAGVIQAAKKAFDVSGDGAALHQLTAQFLQQGLPGVADVNAIVDFSSVLREASAIASAAQISHQRDLGGVISELDKSMYHVLLQSPGEYSRGTASETLGSAPVQKAKSLVADVRQISTSIDLRKIIALSSFSAIVDGGATDALKQFGFNLDLMQVFKDESFDHVVTGAELTIEAAFSALVDYYGKSVIATTYEGLDFTHEVAKDTHTFGFNTTYNACAEAAVSCPVNYDLTVVLRVINFTGNANTFAPGILDYRVMGSVASADLRLNFYDLDQMVRFVRPVISVPEDESGVSGDVYRFSVDALRIRLPFDITKENEAGHESFKGLFAADSGQLEVEYKNDEFIAEDNGGISVISESTLRIEQVEGVKINLSAFAKPGVAGDEFRGSINVTQRLKPIAEPISIKFNSIEWCADARMEACEELKSEVFIENETEENFLGLYASIGVEAKLKGMDRHSLIELSGARSSPDANQVNSLRISYPGHAVAMNGRFSRNGLAALDAINLDGLRLHFDMVHGKRTGVVESSAKEVVADISDMGQWIKVRYINGDFESL